MTVTLDVPDHIRYQLVYRMERTSPSPLPLADGWAFRFLESPFQAARQFTAVRSYCGTGGAVKSVAKLATSGRKLYLVTDRGRAVSAGWCTIGRCRYYKVEPDAVVIGPIWTDSESRGRGLATTALMLAVNELVRRGRTLFYIDTEKFNLPAQRVFAKAGFGTPVALYFR